MRTLSRSCLLLLAAGLCASAPAAATNVYQWKDAKGVTLSSDMPPAGQRNATGRVDTQGQTPPPAAAPAAAAPSPQCATAQRNLTALSGDAPVQQDVDNDGKPDKTLNTDERAAQKTLAEAAVKAYCTPAG